MPEQFEGEILHTVSPEERGQYPLDPELLKLASGQYILVCRAGGHPSWLEQLRSLVFRNPIRATTIVVAEPPSGDTVSMRLEETRIPGVYAPAAAIDAQGKYFES